MSAYPGRTWGAVLVLGLLAVLAASAGPARAQTELDGYIARTITRLALLDLRLAERAGAEDYAIAAELLSIAREFDPEDDAILRYWMEASFEAGDTGAVLEASRLLVARDPLDAVSLLRLVSGRIAELQTVEERIGAYERLIGAERLDVSVRSRLALDAALLKRERGDTRGFAELLARAIEMDPTNKEAAALAATWYADRVNDPLGRFDLLSNLLYADPLDPHVHRTIRDLLAAEGAFEEAMRFHENATRIMASIGDAASTTRRAERLALEWQAQGAEAVVRVLNDALLELRHRAESNLKAARASGDDTPSELPSPDDVRLEREVNTIRLLAAHSAGDSLTVTRALEDLSRSVQRATEDLLKPESRPEGVTTEEVGGMLGMLRLELMLARLWVGDGLDAVEAELGSLRQTIETLEAGEGKTPASRPGGTGAGAQVSAEQYRRELTEAAALRAKSMLPLVEGWLRLRRDDPEGAMELLIPEAESSSLAKLGLALAYESWGMKERAGELLREVARASPVSHTGAWAADRAVRLGVQEGELHPNRETMRSAAASIPAWIDRMAASPRDSMRLSVSLTRSQASPIERAGLLVTIRNLSRIPLGFGPNRAIDSRLLIQPRADAGVRSLQPLLMPEVVDLGRRLRLKAGESLVVEIWPEPASSGLLLQSLATRQTRVRWRVMQGFMVNRQGQYQPGPAGLKGETDIFTRSPLESASVSLEELAKRIRAWDDVGLPELGVSARARLPVPRQEGAEAPEGSAEAEGPGFELVTEALVERFNSGSARERLVIVASLPSSELAPVLAPLDAAIADAQGLDPRVEALVLLTRVVDGDDARLSAARESEDPRLARLATLMSRRIDDGRPFYAKLGRTLPGRAAPGAGTSPGGP